MTDLILYYYNSLSQKAIWYLKIFVGLEQFDNFTIMNNFTLEFVKNPDSGAYFSTLSGPVIRSGNHRSTQHTKWF